MNLSVPSIFIKLVLFGLFCVFLGTTIVHAQETMGVPEQHPTTANTGRRMLFPIEQPYYVPPHAEGILGRYFPNLHGSEAIHFDYMYTGGIFNNARGGMQTKGATSYVGIFDLGITADTEKLGLWKNGTFYTHSFFSHGRNPSRYVQDYQGVAVFAYETPAQVSEYWYEHRFFQDRLKFKGGKQDAGADFFYLESTADFLNSSTTCVPTTRIPTTPNNAWGIAGYYELTKNIHVKAGIYDAQANADKFWMSEEGSVYSAYQLEYHYSLFKKLPGFVYAGAWYDNSEFELLDVPGELRTGNSGFSTGFEQMIYRRNFCDENDMRGVTMFFQISDTRQDRSDLKGFWALGFHWLGVFEDRPDDALGFALNTVKFSDGYRSQENLTYSFETAYELFYKIQLSENVVLQPDLQYVVHPGGQYRDAVVPGVVFQVVF